MALLGLISSCALLIKQIAGALEKEHAEDVFLVLAGIHVAAQIVTGGEKQALETGER